jgi:hypothetical protein
MLVTVSPPSVRCLTCICGAPSALASWLALASASLVLWRTRFLNSRILSAGLRGLTLTLWPASVVPSPSARSSPSAFVAGPRPLAFFCPAPYRMASQARASLSTVHLQHLPLQVLYAGVASKWLPLHALHMAWPHPGLGTAALTAISPSQTAQLILNCWHLAWKRSASEVLVKTILTSASCKRTA